MGSILKTMRKTFTLIEMLVVVAIIAIVASLLMPSLNTAMDAARGVSCQNNFKQIGFAIHQFADDNMGRAPGSGSRLFGSGGSVAWQNILNHTVLKGLPQIPRVDAPPPGSLSCPNAGYTPLSRRSITINSQLEINPYRLKVEIPDGWASGDPNNSVYYLGASLSKSRHPSQMMMVNDSHPASGDGFTYSPSVYANCILVPSPYEYNKVGAFAFRHSSSQTSSMLYIDGHTQLIPALPEFFRRDYFYF